MKHLFLSILCIAGCTQLQAQLNYNWHHNTGDSTSYGSTVLEAIPGVNNNLYVAANAYGNPDVDPGPAVHYLDDQSGSIGYIAVYDPSGNYVNAWCLTCDLFTTVTGMTIADDGDLVLIGYFKGTCDFDPGTGFVGAYSNVSDAFIARYSPAGDLRWVRTLPYGTPNSVRLYGVTEKAGVVCVCGDGKIQTPIDIDPDAAVQLFTPDSSFYVNRGLFLCLDANGNMTHGVGGLGSYVGDVAISAQGEIAACGRMNATCDFDPSADSVLYTSVSPYPYGDFFVVKYTSAGNYGWHYAVGAPSETYAQQVMFDASSNIYVSGFSAGNNIDLDPGSGFESNDASGSFLVKYLADGTLDWSHGDCWSFDLDSLNNAYISGSTGVTCLDPGGVSYWNFADPVTFTHGHLSASPDGNVYLAWASQAVVDVDPGSAVVQNAFFGPTSSYTVLSLHHTLAGIESTTAQTGFSLYPTITSDVVYVNAAEAVNTTYCIYSSTGQCVARGNINGTVTRVEVAGMARGIYYFVIADEPAALRFVVQ